VKTGIHFTPYRRLVGGVFSPRLRRGLQARGLLYFLFSMMAISAGAEENQKAKLRYPKGMIFL